MNRAVALLLFAVAVLAAATPAHAAATKRCGGRVLAASGNTSVVVITPKAKKKSAVVPKDHVYGCYAGRTFALFTTYVDDETNRWTIVGGRYIGDLRTLEGGVQGQGVANTWDARKRVALYGSDGCNNVPLDPDNDETYYGPDAAVFFNGGGMAYTCRGASHIVDAKGDRLLEPAGTEVTGLAVTPGGDRLYYLAGDTAKSLAVG